MILFVLAVATVTLVAEREYEPYCNPHASKASYVIQWQVVLFVQGLLLLDSDLTNADGKATVSVTLLCVNVILVATVIIGYKESSRRLLRRSMSQSAAALGNLLNRGTLSVSRYSLKGEEVNMSPMRESIELPNMSASPDDSANVDLPSVYVDANDDLVESRENTFSAPSLSESETLGPRPDNSDRASTEADPFP